MTIHNEGSINRLKSDLAAVGDYHHRFSIYSNLSGMPPIAIREFWNELRNDLKFFREMDSSARQFMKRYGPDALGASVSSRSWRERLLVGGGFSLPNLELYTLVRSFRPSVVVETGVASGVSTSVILQALSRNGVGRLISIDLPNSRLGGYVDSDGRVDAVYTPPDLVPGWIVPERLRHNWRIVLGKGVDLIESEVSMASRLDFFFHDSEHSISNMLGEFGVAWPLIVAGGCLYADDVTWNTAFVDFFSERTDCRKYRFSPCRRGIAAKAGKSSV